MEKGSATFVNKFIAIPEGVLYDSTISSFAKLVFGELLREQNLQTEPGNIEINSEELAKKYGEEKEVVDVALRELVKAKHIRDLEVKDE